MARTFLYHETMPKGKIFDIKNEADLAKLEARGWVDTPALLGRKKEIKPIKRGRPKKK